MTTWWRHQMETFSALLAICAGNSPITGEFPSQRPVSRKFVVFFDLRLNERLSKQLQVWWCETLSRLLWRHCNVIEMSHDDVIKWKHFPRYWPFVQRPVTQSLGVFFDLRLNKRFSKQSRNRWLETPSRSLWRHCDEEFLAHGCFSNMFRWPMRDTNAPTITVVTQRGYNQDN